jgi:hypothetical protein
MLHDTTETQSYENYSDADLLSLLLHLPPTLEQFARSCFIEDPQRQDGAWIPFDLWPAQVDLMHAFHAQPQHIVLKARQLGVSWIAVVYALWLCLYHESQSIVIVSKDEDAAYEVIRRAAGVFARRPDAPVELTTDSKGEIGFSNGSRIKAFASTENAASGVTGSLVILDEFGKMRFAQKTYTSVMPTINDGGKIIIIGTYTSDYGVLLKKLWNDSQAGRNTFVGHFIPWHARPGRDAAWYARTEANAVTPAFHRQEYPATPEEAFTDTATDEHLLPDDSWWTGAREDLPALDARTPIVIALDAATSNDSFGLVAVSRHPQRRTDVAVRYAREWKPPKGGLIRFGTLAEPDTPRGDLARLIKAHNVVAVVADPYQLHAMLTELRDDGRVYAKAFDQGRDRLEADAQFRQLIINRRIAHDGNAALTEHVKNANIAVDAQSRKLRIVKREPSLKIDLAVCASMACHEALRIDM